MTYVRPSWWLPSLEIVWGIITGLFAMTKNAHQVYVLRAFLGLCESAAYPGMITLFSTSCCYPPTAVWPLILLFSVMVYAPGNGQAYWLLPLVPGHWPDDVWCLRRRYY